MQAVVCGEKKFLNVKLKKNRRKENMAVMFGTHIVLTASLMRQMYHDPQAKTHALPFFLLNSLDLVCFLLDFYGN